MERYPFEQWFVNETFGVQEKASSERSARERCFWVKWSLTHPGALPSPKRGDQDGGREPDNQSIYLPFATIKTPRSQGSDTAKGPLSAG
jgi:hypothetical protein